MSLPDGTGCVFLTQSAATIAVPAVVADLRRAFGGQVRQKGRDEFTGGKHLEIALRAPVAFGAVEHAARGGVVGDFLEREGRAEKVLGETAAAGGIVGGKGRFAGVERKAAVAPVLEPGDLPVGERAGIAWKSSG